MTSVSNNPKMWAWAAGILGIILVVCGFLSQTATPAEEGECKASHYTWASVIIGFIMLLAGFMTLMKMSKKPGSAAASAMSTAGTGTETTDVGGVTSGDMLM